MCHVSHVPAPSALIGALVIRSDSCRWWPFWWCDCAYRWTGYGLMYGYFTSLYFLFVQTSCWWVVGYSCSNFSSVGALPRSHARGTTPALGVIPLPGKAKPEKMSSRAVPLVNPRHLFQLEVKCVIKLTRGHVLLSLNTTTTKESGCTRLDAMTTRHHTSVSCSSKVCSICTEFNDSLKKRLGLYCTQPSYPSDFYNKWLRVIVLTNLTSFPRNWLT